MKKILIGILVLASFSTFAAFASVPCHVEKAPLIGASYNWEVDLDYSKTLQLMRKMEVAVAKGYTE